MATDLAHRRRSGEQAPGCCIYGNIIRRPGSPGGPEPSPHGPPAWLDKIPWLHKLPGDPMFWVILAVPLLVFLVLFAIGGIAILSKYLAKVGCGVQARWVGTGHRWELGVVTGPRGAARRWRLGVRVSALRGYLAVSAGQAQEGIPYPLGVSTGR
jgi:hypothetical protein